MSRQFSLALSVAVLAAVVTGRNIVVTNNCPFTIWPALFTPATGGPVPTAPTGWEAASGTSATVAVPEGWTSGRIWARTGCDFSTALPGPQQCETAGCNGGLLCDPSTGTGVPPASLAEWTLGAQDNYDVSLVDGSNLPLRVEAANCPTGECPVDLNPGCPAELQLLNPAGAIVGCKSACVANLDGNPTDSANCCSGSHNVPATCPSSGVQDYSYFHDACPNAYGYAYDDAAGLKTCTAGSDYTVTFCP